MNRLSFVAATAACAVFAAGSASAQIAQPTVAGGSSTQGFSVGINLLGSSDPLGGLNHVPGLGLGVTAAYGVSNHVSVFARGDVAYQTANVEAGARYSFRSPEARLRPYVEGALTRTGVLFEGARLSGTGLTAGAGVQYFVRRNLALDVGLVHSEGRFTNGVLDGHGFSTTRLNVGFRWHP